MNKNTKIGLFAIMLITSINVLATNEIEALRERLTMLENKKNTSALTISGVVEVEYELNNNATAANTDDINLSTAELGVAGELNQNFDAYITFLFEQGENNDNIAIDEAVLSGRTDNGEYGFSVGRLYVPFGVYETSAISDPVGLDIGETNDEAILLNTLITQQLSASIWKAANENSLDNAGFSLAYEANNYTLGIDLIQHLTAANSENGLAVYGKLTLGDTTLIAEHITETKGINKAQATQIEANWTTGDWILATVYNDIDNFEDYDNNIILAVEYSLTQGAGLAIEYKTQNKTDNTGNDDVITARLAYEF